MSEDRPPYAGNEPLKPRRLTLVHLEAEIEARVRLATDHPDDRAISNFYLGQVSALLWAAGYDWVGSLSEAEARLKQAGVKAI